MNCILKKTSALVLLLMLVITFSSRSQTRLIWGRQYGTNQEEYVRNHVVDKSGNLFIAGNTRGVLRDKNAGKTDGFLTKIDSSGNVVWSRQFGSESDEDVQWSAIDTKSNVYIVGSTTGVLGDKNYGKEDIFLVKYSPEGKKIWAKQFGSDSADVAPGIFVDTKGFIYLTGATMGVLGKSGSGSQDAFIMKLDNNGASMFVQQFGTPAPDMCSAITGDNMGNIFVAGSTFGELRSVSKGFMDGFTGQFTENGSLVKFTQFGSEGFDITTSIILDNEKNIYIGGSTSGNLSGEQKGEGDCFVLKFNPGGELLWKDQFGTEKHDGVKGLYFNDAISENILVSGVQNLPPAHAFIRMYKKDGTMLWEESIIQQGDNRDASGKSVSIGNNGYIYHLGLTSSGLFGKLIGVDDFYLVKLKPENTFLSR